MLYSSCSYGTSRLPNMVHLVLQVLHMFRVLVITGKKNKTCFVYAYYIIIVHLILYYMSLDSSSSLFDSCAELVHARYASSPALSLFTLVTLRLSLFTLVPGAFGLVFALIPLVPCRCSIAQSVLVFALILLAGRVVVAFVFFSLLFSSTIYPDYRCIRLVPPSECILLLLA